MLQHHSGHAVEKGCGYCHCGGVLRACRGSTSRWACRRRCRRRTFTGTRKRLNSSLGPACSPAASRIIDFSSVGSFLLSSATLPSAARILCHHRVRITSPGVGSWCTYRVPTPPTPTVRLLPIMEPILSVGAVRAYVHLLHLLPQSMAGYSLHPPSPISSSRQG